MGDWFQIIVDREASEEEAPRFAEEVRLWLAERRIIEPTPSDCVLGNGPGYRPGPAVELALEEPDPHLYELWNNGFQTTAGRTVFCVAGTELACKACSARVDPEDGWTDAVGAWFDGDDAVTFACPVCMQPERLVDWDGDYPWGFGNLGFEVWNWPPLSRRFVREVTERLGHRTVLVRGKL